ncbi:MAG: phosphoribosylformylglycinamidine cyclo-ligase [Aureispira sp.]|nr:phosphoribosylformylglycinamidine cyclo-ligase [Aureispira sp.]
MANQTNSGLDIDLGNLCSKDAFGWAKSTFQNRQGKAGETALKVDGAFSNMLSFGKQRIGIASDGIGTKIELAERTGIYDTLGFDLVAMVADDLATAGFEPVSISNIIDVDVLNRETINGLMKGLTEACNFSGMSISGGEIAELGNRICGYGDGMHFNWCSTAIGTLPDALESPIDGSQVKADQTVITLQSRGFRSNGFSMVRRIMQAQFGDNWHKEKYNTSSTWGEILLSPSIIYTPFINSLIEAGVIPSGIAHITGGGIFDNFERVLKTNKLGTVLNNLFEPLEVMQDLIKLGNVDAEKAYLYWNMGNGMLMVVNDSEVDLVLETAKTLNYNAQVAGRTTSTPTMHIETQKVKLEKTY